MRLEDFIDELEEFILLCEAKYKGREIKKKQGTRFNPLSGIK
jgi:hypothetical protein